jgi:hypothetical protein
MVGSLWLGYSTEDDKNHYIHITTDHVQGSQLSGRVLTDADFIAHAREDVPALVAEVRRLKAEEQRLKEGLAGVMLLADDMTRDRNERLSGIARRCMRELYPEKFTNKEG